MTTKLKKVCDVRPMLGCDPEFFFTFRGSVIGAEKIIPEKGLLVGGSSGSKFIIDGVQAELNPAPSYCREVLASTLRGCFNTLAAELEAKGSDFQANFSRTVEISKENLMELKEDSRKFGCSPSNTIYENENRAASVTKIDAVDATEYRTRAAGGHIHIGDSGSTTIRTALKERPEKAVYMLDILCGNTSVLVDRDEGNIERRKLYGKAGEYRTPAHGLEYRTLSNYWLTSPQLMSFAFGMARLAIQLVSDANHKEYYEEFTSKVKVEDIHEAINQNNFSLAMQNFKAVEPLIIAVSRNDEGVHPINTSTINEFKYFVDKIKHNGVSHWFKDDPISAWTTNYKGCGFNDYLRHTVRNEMKKEATKVAA